MNFEDSDFVRLCGEEFAIERTELHDLSADEDEQWLQHPVAEKIRIDRLRSDPSIVIIDEGARFFLCWEEYHPEAFSIYEFAGVDRSLWQGCQISVAARTAILSAYRIEHEGLGPIQMEKEITRQEAWELFALNWVPSTFFPEAGISKSFPDYPDYE